MDWKKSNEEIPTLNLKLIDDDNKWLQSDWVIGYWPNNTGDPYPQIGACCFQKSADTDDVQWQGWFNEMLEECKAPDLWAYVEVPESVRKED